MNAWDNDEQVDRSAKAKRHNFARRTLTLSRKQDVKLYAKVLVLFVVVLVYCVTVYTIEHKALGHASGFMPETEVSMTQKVKILQTLETIIAMAIVPATANSFRPGHFATLAEQVRLMTDDLQDMQSSLLFGEGTVKNQHLVTSRIA